MLDRDTRRTDVGTWPAAVSPSPQRIRWGAVFAGGVLGTALLALLTTLWFALAFTPTSRPYGSTWSGTSGSQRS